MGNADGSIVIDVIADDQKAQKELARLNRDMQKTANKISDTEGKHNGIEKQLQEAEQAADKTISKIQELKAQLAESIRLSAEGKGLEYAASMRQKNALPGEIAAQEKLLEKQENEVIKLRKQEENVLSVLKQQREELEKQQAEAGEIEKQLIQASSNGLRQFKEGMDAARESSKLSLKRLLKYGIGIRSLFVLANRLRTGIVESVRAFSEHDQETADTINNLKNHLGSLKLSWGAAFAPILNAVAPMLHTLINWLERAAYAVQRFFAVLGGKSSIKKAVANNNKLAESIGGAGGAAEEAQKQLAGFDEITRLEAQNEGGGGGGIADDAFDIVEESLENASPAVKLGLAVKDALFDWTELSAEQIAEKALVGLLGLGGAISGFKAGGVKGALIGLAAGISFGVLINSQIFDFNGELSTSEIIDAILVAIPALAGLVIGFMAGGHPIIGLTIGVTLGLVLAGEDDPLGLAGFGEQIEEIKKYAVERFEEIGIDMSNGLLNGLLEGAKNIGSWIVENVFDPMVHAAEARMEINSPSRVFYRIGLDIIAGLLNGTGDKWKAFSSFMEEKWNNFRSWWSGLSLSSFPFQLPHLEVQYEQANGLIARLLGITAIPRFSVSWYARGGIVDGATLIGAGEAGKEAIIPLERHTEWLNMVADKLAERLQMGNVYEGLREVATSIDRLPAAIERLSQSLVNIPMPAVAMGTVVPPKALYKSGYGEEGGLMEQLQGLAALMQSRREEEGIPELHVYLDGRELEAVISRRQRNKSRATGV